MDEGQQREDHTDQADAPPGSPEVPTDRPPDEPFVIPPELYDEEPAPRRRRAPKVLLAGVVVLVLLGLVYVGDVLLSRGELPRGTVVAGQDVGGVDTVAAEERLRAALSSRADAPVTVIAGDVTTELDPATSGLSIDWPGTLGQAGEQPLNPVARISSFFTDREISIVTAVDQTALDVAVEGLRAQTDRPAVEGAVVFDGATPVATQPAPGQMVDAGADNEALARRWFDGVPIELPVQVLEPTVTADAVTQAMAVATPAVAGPFTVTGADGAAAVLEPEQIASLLTFVPDGSGGLPPQLDPAVVVELLTPQLADTETEPQDATVRLVGGVPQVVPAADGVTVDWAVTLPDPFAALTTLPERTVPAVYVPQPADLTTEEARALGIREVIGEFTTGGFAPASGVNIRRAAEEVNGAVVLPGKTFSLNGYTGTRGSAQGYVEAGIISNGRAGKGIGGGVSQFATTLYNASYFAGMTDVEHKEHSYYISRYPAAREATVFEGSIDVKFEVPTQTGILIESFGDGSSVTVRVWGTKTVDVESIPGERRNFTSPETLRLGAGDDCSPSGGSGGFTTSDTRVVRAVGTGVEISRETNTVTYNPQPRVVCG